MLRTATNDGCVATRTSTPPERSNIIVQRVSRILSARDRLTLDGGSDRRSSNFFTLQRITRKTAGPGVLFKKQTGAEINRRHQTTSLVWQERRI
jgi:hypothetical protein